MQTLNTGNKRPGKIVEFVNRNNERQKGIAYDDMQKEMFQNLKKVLVHLVKDDMTPLIGESGQKYVSLRNADELQFLGFVD